MRAAKKKPKRQQDTAMERIALLFDSAEREYKRRPDRSRRYVELASRLAMRYNVRLPANLKRKFCKECHMYVAHGAGCRTRVSGGSRVVTCPYCGNISRYPLKPPANSSCCQDSPGRRAG